MEKFNKQAQQHEDHNNNLDELKKENSWKPGESQEKLENIKEVFKQQGYDLEDMDDQAISRIGFHTGFIKTEDGEIEYTKPLLNAQFKPDGETLADKLSIEAVEIPKRRKRANNIGYRTIAVCSDLHLGFRKAEAIHDRRAIDAFLQILNYSNPDYLVNLGDLIDFADISHFAPDSNDFINTLQPTLQEAHNILALQTDATPNAEKRIVIEGNHDARLEKKLLNDASQFHGIKAVGDEYPAMSLPNLLKLDKIGHEYIGGYPANEYQYKEDLIFIHGSGGGANPTRTLQDKYPNENVVQGHLHRIGSELHTRRDGKYIGKYIIGLMGKIDGSLPSVNNGIDSTGKTVKKYEPWQNGAMIINDYGEGNYEFNQIKITKGRAYWQGKKFEGDDGSSHLEKQKTAAM